MAESTAQGTQPGEPAVDTSTWALIDRHIAIGRIDSAIILLDDAIGRVAAQPVTDTAVLIRLLGKKAYVLYSTGKYADAVKFYQVAAVYAEGKWGYWHAETAHVLLSAGNAYLALKDYAQADVRYRQALQVYRQVLGEDHLYTGWAWHDIGITTLFQGRYLESRDNFERALAIKRSRLPENDEDIARTLNYLGFLYNLLGDFEQGESATEQAARISMAHYGPDHLGYYYTKNNLVQLYMARGEFDLAIRAGREAVAGKLRLLDTARFYDVGISYNWLGLAFQEAGLYDSAQTAFERALYYDSISVYREELGVAYVWHNLGTNFMYQGRSADGEAMLGKALMAKRRINGEANSDYYSTLLVHGRALYALGRSKEAFSELVQGRSFLEKNGLQLTADYAFCLEALADVCTGLGEAENAREAAMKLAELSRTKLLTLTNFSSERELVLAGERAARNIRRLYALQRRFSLTDQIFVNQLADETLYYKGFVLYELSKFRHLQRRDTALSATFTQLNMAKALLMAEHLYPDPAGLRLPQVQHQVDSLEKILVRESPSYSAFNRQLTRKDLSLALGADELLIEFVEYAGDDVPDASGHGFAALVFRHGDENAALVYLPADTMDIIPGGHEMGAGKAMAGPAGIWDPLESYLQDVRTIYYVPDGRLYRINPGAMTLADGSWAMERWNIVRLMSSRSLAEKPDETSRHMTASVFGGVAYDASMESTVQSIDESSDMTLREGTRGMLEAVQSDPSRQGAWSYLPGSLEEAGIVGRLLKGGRFKVDLYTSAEATEASLVRCIRVGADRPSPRILHISTHGYFFPEPASTRSSAAPALSVYSSARHPMIRSGLLLAGANGAWTSRHQAGPISNDGILTAYEIGQLDFSDTELVVLSACETGLGDITVGEGVMGLQRAFKVAGAGHIVMSLWAVPDAVTTLLMQEFYMNWIVRGYPLRRSLVAAQLHIRDAGFSPLHWAGFVMVE